MSIVFAKLAISLLSSLLVIAILLKRASLTSWLDKKSVNATLLTGWVLLRLLPFIAIYLIAGQEPTSDVNGFWDEGSKASLGQIVYRDFWSPYSPLYAYFLGLLAQILVQS
jgi:hypothetical protein